MISDKRPVQDFVSLLVVHRIQHVIITPGSRNAPFSLSLFEHADIHSYSIVDERSAAFIALGMAQQLEQPVVLICTSGTAALNFAPAIAEAYYQRVPLIVVTADRPVEWIDQGEGQSIRQRNVYSNYVKASIEIAEEASEGDLVWYNNRIMDEALRTSVEGVHGPIHINFPLRESLYKVTDQTIAGVKTVNRARTHLSIAKFELDEIVFKMNNSSKIMVLAGQMPPDSDLHLALAEFAEKNNVAVFTEAHSNLSHHRFITTIDRMIMGFDADSWHDMQPDILITIGHNTISRKIKDYLRSMPTEHWHVDVSGEGLDTFKHLTKIIPLTPVAFFNELKGHATHTIHSDYHERMLGMNTKTRLAGHSFIEKANWSDLKVFDVLMNKIPSNSHVQMGNSSVVRYILLSDTRPDLNYFGNRGVAGIDGCTSTAVGASFASGVLTTFISGDIGFFYDSNAFWNSMVGSNLKIIVINNGGGGIFRIIEGPRSHEKAMEKFFETKHTRSAKGLAAMYDIEFMEAIDSDSLNIGLDWLYQTKCCAILEIHTPRTENDLELRSFFKYIKENTIN